MTKLTARMRYRDFMRRNYLGVSDLIFLGFLATAFIATMFGLLSVIFSETFGETQPDQAEQECVRRGGVYIEERCWRGELFLDDGVPDASDVD